MKKAFKGDAEKVVYRLGIKTLAVTYETGVIVQNFITLLTLEMGRRLKTRRQHGKRALFQGAYINNISMKSTDGLLSQKIVNPYCDDYIASVPDKVTW